MCLKLLANRNAWYSVTETALTFAQLVERLGGFTPANIESWVFVKSPFTLSHWTMNVVEVLLIVGALWGLRHSVARFKAGESVYLGFWLASVLFMLALEIPVYFPEKLGAPDNALFFHSQRIFSAVLLRASAAVHPRAVPRHHVRILCPC